MYKTQHRDLEEEETKLLKNERESKRRRERGNMENVDKTYT